MNCEISLVPGENQNIMVHDKTLFLTLTPPPVEKWFQRACLSQVGSRKILTTETRTNDAVTFAVSGACSGAAGIS